MATLTYVHTDRTIEYLFPVNKRVVGKVELKRSEEGRGKKKHAEHARTNYGPKSETSKPQFKKYFYPSIISIPSSAPKPTMYIVICRVLNKGGFFKKRFFKKISRPSRPSQPFSAFFSGKKRGGMRPKRPRPGSLLAPHPEIGRNAPAPAHTRPKLP